MSLGTLAVDILKHGVGAQATKLPNSPTPIHYDFGSQPDAPAVTGTVNKTDLTKALGEQIKSEKAGAAKTDPEAKPVKRNADTKLTSAPTARGRYQALLTNRAGFTPQRLQQLTTRPGGAMQRINRVKAQHQPTMAEVNKRMATMSAGAVLQNKTVLTNQAALEQVQPQRMRQVARAGLRVLAAAAPSPMAMAAGLLEAVIGPKPQARRPQGYAQAAARLGVALPAPTFG